MELIRTRNTQHATRKSIELSLETVLYEVVAFQGHCEWYAYVSTCGCDFSNIKLPEVK